MFGFDTVALVGLAVMAVTTAASAYMAYQGQQVQADAAKQQQEAQAAAMAHDAQLQENAAAAMEAQARMEAQRRTAMIRGAQGATGFEVGVGSSLLLELESARIGEYEANLRGYSARQGASQAAYGSQLAKIGAINTGRAGRFAAITAGASTALSGAGSIGTAMIR